MTIDVTGSCRSRFGRDVRYFKRRTSKTGPAATPVARAEIQVIPLKNANAQEVAKVLQTMFRDNEAVVIAAEQQTNQIVVRASPADLQEIKVVTSRLDLASESAPVPRAETRAALLVALEVATRHDDCRPFRTGVLQV